MKVEGILKGDRNSLVSYVSLSVHRVCRAPPPFGRGPHTRGLSVRYEGALGTRYGESLRDSGPVCPSVVRDPPS